MKQIFRKLSLAALVIVGAMTFGCTGALEEVIPNSPEETTPGTPEETQQQPESKTVTLTTTISLGTETKALDAEGVKTFAVGDQVAVIYKDESKHTQKALSTPLVAGDIHDGGKKANIKVTLTDPAQNGALRYIYPAAMAKAAIATDAKIDDAGTIDFTRLNAQNGTLATLASSYDLAVFDGNLTGDAALPASATLTNPLCIGEFTIKDADGNALSVSKLFIGDGINSYYIERASASTDPFWVAMRPVESSQYLTFYATDGTNKYEKEIAGKTLTASNMYPLGIRTKKLQTGALFGTFSVDVSTTVHFSQGNLLYNGTSFLFHTNQYDNNGSWSSSNCDLFFWETEGNYGSGEEFVVYTMTVSDVVDWGANPISGATGEWSTPSKNNWDYLFNTRTASTVGGTANGRFAKACIFGPRHGIILFPDHYTHPADVTAPTGVNGTGSTSWEGNNYSAADWAKMEAAGAVFLPVTGSRNGSTVGGVGLYGKYWSSTAYETEKYDAYYFGFSEDTFDPNSISNRYFGLSVRLVGE